MDSETKIIIAVTSGIIIFTIVIGFIAGCLFGVFMSHHMLAEIMMNIMTGVHVDIASINLDINETMLVDEMVKHMPEK
ncbi:hypothetical protein GQ472_00705 [archaeon]|nr:hypothetical protein [archaeon]